MGKGNLPPEAQEDLEVTETDIWQEINAYFARLPDIQPGDVTTSDYAERRGISTTAALKQMHELARNRPDTFVMVMVHGRNGGRWVLRKRTP